MKFEKKYNPGEREIEIRKFWEESGIFTYKPDPEKPVFSIDTPPPYVSASHLHAGHAMSYTQAEIIVRFKRMCGFNIFYPMGFDDNGLPTERYVETKYSLEKNKINREDFIELCLKETDAGIKIYKELWDSLGISVDWNETYSTIDERCRKTSQLSFIDLYKKGLIKRKDEPIQWCTKCETSLAQADIETKETDSEIHDIIFKGPENEDLIISTTRPELIPACVALYFSPGDARYAHLINKKAIAPVSDHEIPILSHKDVDKDFGTGLMMVCTWGDSEDVIKWKEDKLDTRLIFNRDGKMNDTAGEFSGMDYKEARKEILKKLRYSEELISSKKITHQIGIHERCGTPVEFSKSPQWFIEILKNKKKFLELGNELNWYPEHMKSRFDNWVEGLKWEWCISRQRNFGVPFPLWFCKECNEPLIAEYNELPIDPAMKDPTENSICKCGSKQFIPETDVMDTWMTSSLTPMINSRWAYNDKK